MSKPNTPAVMIVDDEEGVVKALRRLLAGLDCELLTASDGQAALEILRHHQVAVIISDQRMPRMSGVELLRESRQLVPDATRILLTGYADIEATVDAINSGAVKYYFNKPWDDELLLSRVRESLELQNMTTEKRRLEELTHRQNEQLKTLNDSLQTKVLEQTAEIRMQHEELIRSFMETIKAFSTVLGLRFKEVGNHSQRVANLVKRLIAESELGQKEHQDIVVAAFLHDIGKISVPDKALQKHPRQLTSEEMALIARHPVLGQSCVYQISGFEDIGFIIRHHHENYDGSGYPDGLLGVRIPLGARLIRLADAFDHVAFANGYPDRTVLKDAQAELVRMSGTQLDPTLVRKLLDLDLEKLFFFSVSSDTDVVDPDELAEGMVIAEDIHTRNGMFLLPRGAKLSKGMISRIRKIHHVDPVPSGVQVYKLPGDTKEAAADDHVHSLVGR